MTGSVGPRPAVSVSVARTTLNVAIFLAALMAVCATVRAMLPFPEVKGILQKWTHFRSHQGRYNALFIGSSRVYRQIIPPQFDERVKTAGGQEVHSFNFGMDALWPPESCFMLRKILDAKSPRLRWVFIEVMSIMTRIEHPGEVTRRLAYWHDAPHTWMALREISGSNLPLLEKWTMLDAHGSIFLLRSTNHGRAAEWCGDRMMKKAKSKDDGDTDWIGAEGFVALENGGLTGQVKVDFERGVEKARGGLRPVPIQPVFREALDRMIAEVRSNGAEPILFLSPSVNPRENLAGLPKDVPIWSFRDLQRYPDLFEANYYHDASHLNRGGAEIYTNLLADRFVEHLSERR